MLTLLLLLPLRLLLVLLLLRLLLLLLLRLLLLLLPCCRPRHRRQSLDCFIDSYALAVWHCCVKQGILRLPLPGA